MDLSLLCAYTQVADCVKTMILARPDYREAVRLTREACLDLAIGALPDDVRNCLFRSHTIRNGNYSFITSLKDVGVNAADYPGPYLLPGALSGGSKDWWREYAVGLVAQAILSGTKETAKRLSREKVEGFLAEREQQLNQFAYLMYADLYTHNIDSELKWAWHDAQVMNTWKAASQYCSVLKSSVVIHEIWAASGAWPDIRQELYHHYIKLTSLYVPPAQIDELIGELKAAGLPVAAELDAKVWHQYTGAHDSRPWLTADELLPLCRDAMNESRILPRQGWWDVRMDPIWVSEYAAMDFLERYGSDFCP